MLEPITSRDRWRDIVIHHAVQAHVRTRFESRAACMTAFELTFVGGIWNPRLPLKSRWWTKRCGEAFLSRGNSVFLIENVQELSRIRYVVR